MPPSWLGKKRESQSGPNHPNYGSVAYTAIGVSIFTLDGEFVQSFPSQTAAAKWLGMSQPALRKAILRKFVVKSQYRVVFRKEAV